MSKKIREKSVEELQTPPSAARVHEGDMAPAFSILSDGGHQLSNADFAGHRLVVFFYPKAGTEGCTQEATDFNRLASGFASLDTGILGVSADSPKALQKFRQKHSLSIPLASDETHQMLEAYGVWAEKKMYGRTFLGILRTTFVINADGRIERVWRNVKVKDHAEAVLAALKC